MGCDDFPGRYVPGTGSLGNEHAESLAPNRDVEWRLEDHRLTVEPGDVFVCGTCGGVGMGTGTFLKVGDVMETEVEGLGQMRNRLVEDQS